MTVYNFGSINADYFYQVPYIPAPGETLAATGLDQGLGGKGANQSVAMVQAGADLVHLGTVGIGCLSGLCLWVWQMMQLPVCPVPLVTQSSPWPLMVKTPSQYILERIRR